MFYFFPGNYMWSQAVLRVLFTGGSPGDVIKAVTELQDAAGGYDAEAWYRTWRALGDRLWALGEAQQAVDHPVSARGSYYRACGYYQWAVSFMDHHDPRRAEVHTRSVEGFGRYGALSDPPIERVEVPYEGRAFPAWFVPPPGAGTRQPAVFYLPGWDSTKEQGMELALALRERGFSTLLCDGPGIGEAVLFRGMVNRHDYEVVGSAAYDYLAGRADVDAARIVVVGASMGGYRAGRVASFEHRLAAAVAWSAVWDFRPLWARRRDTPQGAVPTPPGHALFVMGARDLEEVTRKFETWHLDEVAHQMRCPFLVLHGQDDAQTPPDQAYAVYEGSGSAQKELKIYTAEEGASAHCQNDNRVLAHDYIGDWLLDVVVRGKSRGGIHVGPARPAAARGGA